MEQNTARTTDGNSPVKLRLISGQQPKMNLDNQLHVIFALDEGVCLSVNHLQYAFSFGGLLVVNPYSPYAFLCGQDSMAYEISIAKSVLEIAGWDANKKVSCYVKDDAPGEDGGYNGIRTSFAKIFKAIIQSPLDKDQYLPETLRLLRALSAWQIDANDNGVRQSGEARERTESILLHIQQHWHERIAVEQIAERFYISTGYMARLFKRNLGMTVTDYLSAVRLQHAAEELRRSDSLVTEVAYANGFASVNAFIKQFREKYGQTPRQYRMNMSAAQVGMAAHDGESSAQDRIARLLEYAADEEHAEEPAALSDEIRLIRADISADGVALRHTWRRLMNVFYASDVLLAPVQTQISKAQKDIGFEYIRFHGILDDDMFLYHENERGEPYLDFSLVDMLLDFIVSQNLKLYMELSYMPRALAKRKKVLTNRITYLSMYADEDKWRFLIRGLIEHCIKRYGRQQVLTWRFATFAYELVSFGMLDSQEFMRLYSVTCGEVKSVDARLQFGGPGLFGSQVSKGRELPEFLSYARIHGCLPDFFTILCYPYGSIDEDAEFWNYLLSQASAPSVLSRDTHYTRSVLQSCRETLAPYGLDRMPIWVEEWNSTMWQKDLAGDTCYKAAWLAQNICDTYDGADAFGYWLLTDFFEDRFDFGGVFHGGYGLFTYNSIPKSGYLAMCLARGLGDEKLASGDGWMVARGEGEIEILLSHYCHYDNLYCLRYQRLTDPKKAYDVFVKHGHMEYSVHLTGMKPGRYSIRRRSISPEHGSAFDNWIRIDAQPDPLEEEREYLARSACPDDRFETAEVGAEYHFKCRLEPHEVQFITIKRMNR